VANVCAISAAFLVQVFITPAPTLIFLVSVAMAATGTTASLASLDSAIHTDSKPLSSAI
jgi:hypothetical protein